MRRPFFCCSRVMTFCTSWPPMNTRTSFWTTRHAIPAEAEQPGSSSSLRQRKAERAGASRMADTKVAALELALPARL